MEIEEEDPFYLPEDHAIVIDYEQRAFYKKYAPWIVSSVNRKRRLTNFELRYFPIYYQVTQDIALCKKFKYFIKPLAFKYIQLRLQIEYSGVETVIFDINWMKFDEYMEKEWKLFLLSSITLTEIERYLLFCYERLRSFSSGKIHPDCQNYLFFSRSSSQKCSGENKI